jgi:hypothetical protein
MRRAERVRSTAIGIAAVALVVLLADPRAGRAACAELQFRPATPGSFGSGSFPISVAVGDFNADSQVDLAVALAFRNQVGVLLGTGPGAFGSPTTLPVGTIPTAVTVGDFDVDGNQDLAAANASSNNVSILLGTGTGSFGAATNFPVGALSYPRSVVVGDFNADGLQDLAVANAYTNDVAILPGAGAGAFGAATNFAAGSSPSAVVVGDFNADSLQDLAVANANSANVSVLLGTGTGAFGAPTNFAAGSAPFSIAVGDFDADGQQDLAVANRSSNNVSVLLGTGTGSFAAATNFAVAASPQSVAVADFDADGTLDLAVASQFTNNVSVLLGTGTGSFGAATNFAAGASPQSVVAADLNADGTPDLAVANQNTNDVSILLNTCSQLTLGSACTGDGVCASGFCRDGVCCNSDCGGGTTADCQACAVAAGAPVDGICAPATSSTECRKSTGVCDPAESCNGSLVTCPTDLFEDQGAQPPGCEGGLACNGSGSCLTATGGACKLSSECASGYCFMGTCLAQAPTDTPTDTPTATATATPTATPTPTAVPGCAPVPQTGCRVAQKSLLFARNNDDDRNDKLIWKWIKGQPMSQSELSDPTSTAPYRLCIYAGLTPVLIGEAVVPASGSRWSEIGTTGYKYNDLGALEDGIAKALVKGSEEERSKAVVKGKGLRLPDLPFGSITPPLAVQFVNVGNGFCMGADYADFQVIINDTGQLRATVP